MKTIIKRELKNYLKNPIFWAGTLFILFELFQILNPYLKLHYIQTQQDKEALERINLDPDEQMDADITDGYVRTSEKERMEIVYEKFREEASLLEISNAEADTLIEEMRSRNMTLEEAENYLISQGYFADLNYYYVYAGFHKGSAQEINDYLEDSFSKHTFSYYFGRKFADFCGLYMGFFGTILLAFLFIRDTKRDTYELLHTKPISAGDYILGKILGGFCTMLMVWGGFTLLFGGLCEMYGLQSGFPVSIFDFLKISVVYILPNMLMITCIYTLAAMVFKNPLPAIPCMFLYLIYSNLGSVGPDGNYGYYGHPQIGRAHV